MVFLLVVVVAFYLYGLGHLPLVGPDEPRYAQVAREMLLRHDLITPTLGGHTWFEKPALLYWMMIASFKLFGVSEWAARLPAAVSGLLTVAAVFFVGNRLEGKCAGAQLGSDSLHGLQVGFWSALAAATTIGIVAFSRAASFDILLTMTTTWSLAFYILSESEENTRRHQLFLFGFYCFIGLSLLAKGLIGIVIPVGVVFFYQLFRKRVPEKRVLVSLLWGIPLALAVAATWYGPVIVRHGWPFIDQFFIQHHFARYVSRKYHHTQPFYFYLVVLPLLVLPWNAFLFDAFVRARRWPWRAKIVTTIPADDPLRRLLVFALAWLLFPLLFFSFSDSKLPGYILPVVPAVTLIVGERLWRLASDSTAGKWPIKMTGSICLLVATMAFIYQRNTSNFANMLVLLVAAPLYIAGGFALLAPRRTTTSILMFAGATAMVMIVLLLGAAPAFAELESSKRLLQLADARGYSAAVIYGMQRSDRTPEFYAAGRVVYGTDGEPIMYEGPAQIIEESRRRKESVLTFVPLAEVSQLTGMAAARAEVIGNNGRYAIIAVNAGSAGILPAARGAASPEL
jgi:4-amino-4-deoxy-L-arabinose transferase-like glycosyltransferase